MAVKATATITLTRVNDGAQGPAGKGIKSTSVSYQAGISGTTAPTGTWSSSIPTVPLGQYLWSRHVVTYTDDSTSTTYSVAYIPQNGKPGSTGKSVVNIIQQYYLSTSKTTQTGGTWVTTMPTWSRGKYLWTRFYILYANPTSTAFTNPVCDSSWEAVNDVEVELEKVRAEFEIEKDRITSTVEKTNQLESKTSILEQTAEGLTLRLDQTDKNVSDAAKTATNYISADSKGITIGDVSGTKLGSNVLIDNDSLNIRNGDNILAKYEKDKIMLGIGSPNTIIDFYNGKAIIEYNETYEEGYLNEYFSILSQHSDVHIVGKGRVIIQDTEQKGSLLISNAGVDLDFSHSIVGAGGGSLSIGSVRGTEIRSYNTRTSIIAEKYVSGGYDGTYLILDATTGIEITASRLKYYGGNGFAIISSMEGSWINGLNGIKVGLSIDVAGNASGFNALARVKTTNGAYVLGSLNTDSSFRIGYGNQSRLNSGTNGTDALWTFYPNGDLISNVFVAGSSRFNSSGCIELYGNTPFIDFHYNGSSSDFTSRIIESNNGVLNINNVEIHKSKIIRYPSYGSSIIWLGTGRDFGIASLSNGATLNLYTRNSSSSSWTSSIVLADAGGIQIAAKNHIHDRVGPNAEAFFRVTEANGNLIPGGIAGSIGNGNNPIINLYYKGALHKSSDRRLKNDLGNLQQDEALKILRDLSIKKYTFKDDAKEIVHYGAFAQDVRDLLMSNNIGHTSMIRITEIDESEDGREITQLDYPEDRVTYGLDYVELMTPVIVGWQYHDEKISRLKEEVTELKQRQRVLELKLRQKITELEGKLSAK